MTALFALVGIAVVAAIGIVSVGRLGQLDDAEPDLTPDRLALDEVSARDVDSVRFDVTLRGYRMDEVDALLDRVGERLAAQDREIAVLRSRLGEPGTTR